MRVSFGFLRKHWHNVLFVFLLILVYVVYASFTDTIRYKRRKDVLIESLENKKDLESKCNQLSRELCGCYGSPPDSCGWLALRGSGKCVAGDERGPYYRSDPIQAGQKSINKHYPLSSYEFRRCAK
jgi:hypothetical protein